MTFTTIYIRLTNYLLVAIMQSFLHRRTGMWQGWKYFFHLYDCWSHLLGAIKPQKVLVTLTSHTTCSTLHHLFLRLACLTAYGELLLVFVSVSGNAASGSWCFLAMTGISVEGIFHLLPYNWTDFDYWLERWLCYSARSIEPALSIFFVTYPLCCWLSEGWQGYWL